MRERLDLNLPRRDWREGWLRDTAILSHREMPVMGTFLRSRQKKDEEITIARAECEKAAQDPVIQDVASRLDVPVHFLLGFRERAIRQYGPHLERLEGQEKF